MWSAYIYYAEEMKETIVNKVKKSPLITFNLEEYYTEGERILLDIKDQLFRGLILRERDFRAFVKAQDWSQYEGKYVAITCSADAIVPMWAYMLLATKLEPYAAYVCFGTLDQLEVELFKQALSKIDLSQFEQKPVVIKGCSNKPVPIAAYVEITRLIRPYARSIMYGEPCSTVPLYKKPRKQ